MHTVNTNEMNNADIEFSFRTTYTNNRPHYDTHAVIEACIPFQYTEANWLENHYK